MAMPSGYLAVLAPLVIKKQYTCKHTHGRSGLKSWPARPELNNCQRLLYMKGSVELFSASQTLDWQLSHVGH